MTAPLDPAAAAARAAQLIAAGEAVPLAVEEAALRHHLAIDPMRHDLAFRLAMILVESGRDVAANVEEGALRHALAADPGRLDLATRLGIVTLETVLAPARAAMPRATPDGGAAIMARARARLDTAGGERAGLPPLGVRWEAYAARMRAAIADLPDPVAALHLAQTGIGFEHRLPAAAALREHALVARELAGEFPQFTTALAGFDDPPQSAPETQFTLDGRPMSNIVPYLARIVLGCLSLLPEPPRRVLELGGGYGAPARAWLTNQVAAPATYIIVDIAESLFFADAFLSLNFGPEAVFYVPDSQPLDPALLDRHRVLLCPVERLDALAALPVDLIVNTGSLQEMSEPWVDHYMSWLDRQPARFFYSLNYAAQPVGALAESVNLWSARPSSAWVARQLRWNPPLLRMQADRNFLEAVYEKQDAALSPAAAMARLGMLAERAMTGQILVEQLDLFRRCPTAEVALSVLRRAMREMPFQPKEALWLAQWLLRQPAAPWQAEVTVRCEALAAARAAGVEGTR